MKFNLKNRPKEDRIFTGSNDPIINIDEWFEGFEKELNEKIKETQCQDECKCSMPIADIDGLSLIKEILGEKS